MKRNIAAIIASYITVYIVWGSTYLAINWAVETIPPYYLVSLRFLASGFAFLLIALFQGKLKPLPTWKEFLSAASSCSATASSPSAKWKWTAISPRSSYPRPLSS
jgi:drug/metabolite transporter (DMT)-like permease